MPSKQFAWVPVLTLYRMSESPAGVAVLVMGATGVGKSRFISKLIGDDTGIGHSLKTCEYMAKSKNSVNVTKTYSTDTHGVEFHSMTIKNRPVYLVDTPGFNDTYRSDFEVFSEIAFILSQIHRRGIKIAGILYLHRISDNRVSGSAARNLKLLESICGLDAAPRMFLVTTMWESIEGDKSEALRRESELVAKKQFWGRFVEHGSQAKRWRGSDSSALLIVDDLISLGDATGCKPLLIQKELVEQGKALRATTAGLELMSEYKAVEMKLSQKARTLPLDEIDFQDATVGLSGLTNEIKEMKEAQKKLMVSTRELFAERELCYRKVVSMMREDQRKLSAELGEQMRKYERLQYYMQRDNSQHETQDEMSQISQYTQKLKKREVMKRNMLPFMGVLAGVGLTAAGAATGLIPLAGAGVGLTVSSASELKLSRKAQHEGSYTTSQGSFLSNSSATAFNGAQISSLLVGGNN